MDYAGHDRQYLRRKDVGLPGWNTEQVAQENIAQLQLDLVQSHMPQSGDLLEVGCGDGDLSLWLAGKGYRVHGIGISPTAIEWAKDKALKRTIKAEFVVGDVRALEVYAKDSFGVVLDGYCLHCLIGDADRKMFLNNVHRVLRPGG